MDRGAWWAIFHGITKGQTQLKQLSTHTHARYKANILFSVHFSSVAQSCVTLCDPMNCSMPGFPVHHQLWAFAQTHVHQVDDAT